MPNFIEIGQTVVEKSRLTLFKLWPFTISDFLNWDISLIYESGRANMYHHAKFHRHLVIFMMCADSHLGFSNFPISGRLCCLEDNYAPQYQIFIQICLTITEVSCLTFFKMTASCHLNSF